MRHQRVNFSVANMENALHNVLFYFLNFTTLGTFFDNRFDFFFGNFAVGCGFNVQNIQ